MDCIDCPHVIYDGAENQLSCYQEECPFENDTIEKGTAHENLIDLVYPRE